MASTCSTPEKCLFAGCNGECHPPIAAFTPATERIIASLHARAVTSHPLAFAPVKLRDSLAHRRLLVALS